ncbi:MAG TPA: hypothetical protein VMA09_00860 [Candidatus Binataceae bacterium]|nr:hypothetical protein [Candidatus Binataceae bacterium]
MINLLANFAPLDFLRFLDVFSEARRRFGGRALSVHHDNGDRVTIALQFDTLPMFEAFLAEPEVAGILRAAREMNGCQLIPESDDRKAA